MRAAGFEPDDFAHEEIEIWPDNVPAFNLFSRVGTRWVVGMSGPTGLRYEAIYPLMDRMGLDAAAWDDLLSDIEVMEDAALKVMHKASSK